MRGLRFTGLWIFLILGGSATVGLCQGSGGQRQTGTMPPIQQAPSGRTNYPTMPSMPGMGPMMGTDSSGGDVLNSRMAVQQARSRNNERQKRLELDTEKLVGLVTQFNQQVRSDEALSPDDVSKRAEEIEKLARSVKDKMKG